MAATARISVMSDLIIQELANTTGKSKIEIIEEALKSYRFHERMKLLNEEYFHLQSNEELWKKELEERKLLEGTILDGLED